MGFNTVFAWFERKSLDELYEIKEKEWDKLNEQKRECLLKAIAKKEGK